MNPVAAAASASVLGVCFMLVHYYAIWHVGWGHVRLDVPF